MYLSFGRTTVRWEFVKYIFILKSRISFTDGKKQIRTVQNSVKPHLSFLSRFVRTEMNEKHALKLMIKVKIEIKKKKN